MRVCTCDVEDVSSGPKINFNFKMTRFDGLVNTIMTRQFISTSTFLGCNVM